MAQQSKKFQLSKAKASKEQTAKNMAKKAETEQTVGKVESVVPKEQVRYVQQYKNGGSRKKSSVVGACGSSEVKFSTRTRNLALMLIPVNVLFLMFMAPVVITMYIYENLFEDKLTLAIVELLSYCNFSINFFIYFLTSSKFREEFFKLLNELAVKFNINYAKSENPMQKMNGNMRASIIKRNQQSVKCNPTENSAYKAGKMTVPLISINTSKAVADIDDIELKDFKSTSSLGCDNAINKNPDINNNNNNNNNETAELLKKKSSESDEHAEN